MRNFLKKMSGILLLLLCCTILSGCQSHKQTQTKHLTQIKVVSTTNFYGQVAQEVLGKHGKVTSIIDSPNVDPHDFTPTVATAKKVAKANLVIYNGVGYDTWVKRLQGSKYLSVAQLVGAKDGDNEHLWYNPQNVERLTDALVTQYSKLLPQYRTDFERNAQQYKQKLHQLDAKMDQIKHLKTKTTIAVSEPAFDYALKAMGFHIIDNHFSLAIEEGSDPSYTDIAKLQNAIKQHRIAFFVLNKQSESKIVDNMVKLCKQEHIPIVKVTETMPSNDSYIEWFDAELNQILKIVKQHA